MCVFLLEYSFTVHTKLHKKLQRSTAAILSNSKKKSGEIIIKGEQNHSTRMSKIGKIEETEGRYHREAEVREKLSIFPFAKARKNIVGACDSLSRKLRQSVALCQNIVFRVILSDV